MRRECTKKPVILVTKPLAGHGGVTDLRKPTLQEQPGSAGMRGLWD